MKTKSEYNREKFKELVTETVIEKVRKDLGSTNLPNLLPGDSLRLSFTLNIEDDLLRHFIKLSTH